MKQILTLLFASLLICCNENRPHKIVVEEVTGGPAPVPPIVAELRVLANTPPPMSIDWCEVLTWNKKLTDFMWHNQVWLEKNGYNEEVTAEFQRRSIIRNIALLKTLERKPVVPDCHFSDQVYDPVKWIVYAQHTGGQAIPKPLLLRVVREIVKEPRFQYIRSESWEARVNALHEWRHFIVAEIGIEKRDLRKLGLTDDEVRQIYWNVERGQK